MKTKPLMLLFIVIVSIEIKAQTLITNGGFEQWTFGHPDYWASSDFLDITQTTDKASGVYAAKMYDVTNDAHSYFTTTSNLAFGEHPTYAACYFKFGNFTSGDIAGIRISLIDTTDYEIIVAQQSIQTYLTTYTPITISFSSLTYSYITNPTKIKIEVEFNSNLVQNGEFFVDDFVYGGNATGINNPTIKSGLEIYPNPSNGRFKLKKENNSTINSIEITNTIGEKIYTMSNLIPQSENEIDLSNNPKGIYFVRIYDGTKIHSEKIVIN